MRVKHLALLISCYLFPNAVQAQKGAIKGLLLDSLYEAELPYATITVFKAKDTTIITYGLSDTEGEFHLTGIPLDVLCRMVVTFQGYKVYRKEFELTQKQSKLDLGIIQMTEDTSTLEDILVVAERPPVIMRNDTLEFNASAFKMLPSALLEDLLKKLPGVDVDLDGNIAVNGKKVNRLLVDGKEFFGTDHRIATRHLPANIVDAVQVVDDKEELKKSPLKPKDEIGQVINIRLKKAIKQGWFGKAYAGTGTNKRHEIGGIVNLFREDTQVSLLAHSNNVNKPGFSFEDMHHYGGRDNNLINSGFSQRGIQTSVGSGMNYNTQIGKKLKINLQYFYGRTDAQIEQLTNQLQFLKDTILRTPATYRSQSITRNHHIGGSIEWQIDSMSQLVFRPKVTINDDHASGYNNRSTFDNFTGIINQNEGETASLGDDIRQFYSLSYSTASRKKEGRSLNAQANFSRDDGNNAYYNDGAFSTFKNNIKTDSLINQLRDGRKKNVHNTFDFNFHEPISNYTSLTITYNAIYSQQQFNQRFYTHDLLSGQYIVYNEDLSNGIETEGWEHRTGAAISTRYKEWNFAPGINFQLIDKENSFLKNPAVHQRLFYVYPSFSFGWKRLSLNYQAHMQEPSAFELRDVIDLSNPLYKHYGNRKLQPAYTKTLTLNYHAFGIRTGSSFHISITGSTTENATLNETFLDSNRVQISRPVNINGVRTYSTNASYSRRIKFSNQFQISLRPSLSAGLDNHFVSVNGIRSRANNMNASFQFNVMLNYKDIIELGQRYGTNFYKSSFEDTKNYRNNETVTHSTESALTIRWPNRIVWESQVYYTYTPKVSPGFRQSTVRMNAAINYMFLKEEKGQLKLSVFDLLDQNVSTYRYALGNSITEGQSAVLRRYFLLSMIYNIRTFSSPRQKTIRSYQF